MALWKAALVGVVILLGGCSFARNSLLPTLTGEKPSAQSEDKTGTNAITQPAPSGAAERKAAAAESGKPTGTTLGKKIEELRKELAKLESSVDGHGKQLQTLRGQVASNAEQYQQLVAKINAKLQVGAPPGDPALITDWNKAQSTLGRIDGNVVSMNSLAGALEKDSATASSLLGSARTAEGLSDAVDEDRRALGALEDELNRLLNALNRSLNDTSAEISRQTLNVARERGNLITLSLAIKNGELFGPSLANIAYSAEAPLPSPVPASRGKAASLAGRRPLVVIRFTRPDVKYEPALYSAVSQALARKPGTVFDLVAIAPQKNGASAMSQSKRNADAVMRSLTSMGLPPSRITLSATTSTATDSNEVRLYVR